MKVEAKDVRHYGTVASVTSRRKARQSRALDDRDYTFTFLHVPSGKQVKIRTGVVHWSRKQTKLELEKLRVGEAVRLLSLETT